MTNLLLLLFVVNLGGCDIQEAQSESRSEPTPITQKAESVPGSAELLDEAKNVCFKLAQDNIELDYDSQWYRPSVDYKPGSKTYKVSGDLAFSRPRHNLTKLRYTCILSYGPPPVKFEGRSAPNQWKVADFAVRELGPSW